MSNFGQLIKEELEKKRKEECDECICKKNLKEKEINNRQFCYFIDNSFLIEDEGDTYPYCYSDPGFTITLEINYCPFCGRKLNKE